MSKFEELLIRLENVPTEGTIRLGSGTGLVGLAAAALWKRCVVVTDLPAIIPNLTYNVELNYQAIERAGGKILVAPLDWAHHEEALVSWSERNFQVRPVECPTSFGTIC